MSYFLADGDVAGGAEDVDIAYEGADAVWGAGVVCVGGLDPEAVAEFGVGVGGLVGGEEVEGAEGGAEAVSLADGFDVEAVMTLVGERVVD